MNNGVVSYNVDDQSSKIEALTMALKKTKDELIHWALMPDEDGDTSIHLAVIREDDALSSYLCRLLASSGYSLDIRNKLMQTPLHLSCILGNLKSFWNLLKLEATKVECGDRHGNTCLHLAVKHDDQMCELLRIIMDHLRKKEDSLDIINAKNIHGYSALHIASSINKPEAIRLLVAHGAEINQPDTKSGTSPLYIAVKERNGEAAQALLELGADANKLTYFRDSPSQLASSQDRRSLLRLISRYDPSSQAQTPGAGCRRDSHRGRGIVNEGGCYFEKNRKNEQINAGMSATDDTPPVDESDSVRRKIGTNLPSRSERAGITGGGVMAKFVKRESISPVNGTPSAYPMPASNAPQRGQHFETEVSQTIPDRQTKENVAKVREQLLLTAGPLSHVLSPAVMAASLYQQERLGKAGPCIPIFPLMTDQLERHGIPHSHGVLGDQVPDNISHVKDSSTTKCMTSETVRATERTCVSDESSSAENAVSKRNPGGTTSKSEPLDLSQSRDEEAEMNNISANMLLEGEMNVECDSDRARKGTPERETDEDIRRRVKQEVVENDATAVQDCETAPHSEHSRSLPAEQSAFSNASLHSAKFSNAQNLREAFIPFASPWVNFPAAILNPAFLPQAYAGFIPAALASVQTHPALTCIDPSAFSQRNDCLSQWVNLSMDVARAVAVTANENQNSRKRKLADSIQDQMSESKEHMLPREYGVPGSVEAPKRFCVHETSDGLHRSASDDSGNGRLKDQESSKSKLRRRNSAPSSGLVSDVMQEEQTKVAPVDLLSYRGCLPPHYLHLLRASGNLVTERENTLRDAVKVYPAHHVDKITSSSDRQITPMSSNGLQRSVPSQRNALSHYRAQNDIFDESARSVTSPILMKKTNLNHRRESFSPAKHNRPGDKLRKISCTASAPIYPRSIYLSEHQNHEKGSSCRKNSLLPAGFSKNERRRSNDKTRRNSETDSDDDNHIEKLQISDASSDEEGEKIEISRHRMNESRRSLLESARSAKRMGTIEFGKGSWADLDTGKLPAFGGSIAVPDINRTSSCYSDRIFPKYLSTPTKMASSLSRNFPQALNGLPRVYCTSKIFATERKVDRQEKALAQEFASHDFITTPRKEFQVENLKLPTRQSLDNIEKHNCNGCSWLNSSTKHDEHRLKLIGDIFQTPLNVVSSHNGYHRTTPRCVPRLVFTSEIKPPGEVEHRKKLGTESTAEHDFFQPKSTSDVDAVRHTEKVQTSSAMYSLRPFSFARTTTEANNYNVAVAQSVISGRKDSLNASEGERPSILSGSTVLASRTKTNSSTSATARLSTLVAKLEELRQKATEREVQRSEGTSNRSEQTNEMQADSDSMKSEVISANARASHSPTARLNAQRKPCTSPFYENDSSRFMGKRNIAVIKPNQSVSGAVNNEDRISGYACPPKKRHMKRFSPEFYAKPQSDTPLQERVVRSASPLPHPPFVSTNVRINNDDHSLNVRWCSPERSPNRRKLHGSNSRTILTYRVPLGQRVRGSNSHTVTLERNYRKFPRCVQSPSSDAVIVVESRLAENTGDQKEERLEIEDLEISDDET